MFTIAMFNYMNNLWGLLWESPSVLFRPLLYRLIEDHHLDCGVPCLHRVHIDLLYLFRQASGVPEHERDILEHEEVEDIEEHEKAMKRMEEINTGSELGSSEIFMSDVTSEDPEDIETEVMVEDDQDDDDFFAMLSSCPAIDGASLDVLHPACWAGHDDRHHPATVTGQDVLHHTSHAAGRDVRHHTGHDQVAGQDVLLPAAHVTGQDVLLPAAYDAGHVTGNDVLDLELGLEQTSINISGVEQTGTNTPGTHASPEPEQETNNNASENNNWLL